MQKKSLLFERRINRETISVDFIIIDICLEKKKTVICPENFSQVYAYVDLRPSTARLVFFVALLSIDSNHFNSSHVSFLCENLIEQRKRKRKFFFSFQAK